MFLVIISIIVFILHILKIVYVLFEPKFLNPERFGPPKTKLLLILYYLMAIFFLLTAILEHLGVLRIEMEFTGEYSFNFTNGNALLIILISGLVLGTLIPFVVKLFLKNKQR
jgi:hypothetical protein